MSNTKRPDIHPALAAIAILSLVDAANYEDPGQGMGTPDTPEMPEEFRTEINQSPEPYRAAAYLLGWEKYDGSHWWGQVMDEIG